MVQPQFELVRGSEVVARKLRAMIVHGELAEVTRLPPEPEFAEQLGISRHILRESLRLLERDGLVEIRRGHTGGIFITTPDADVLARGLEAILARTQATVGDAFEAYAIVEADVAWCAASRATAVDIAALREILARQEAQVASGEYALEASNEFHQAVAKASGNKTILLLKSAIDALMYELALGVLTLRADTASANVESHRDLLKAIEAHDPVAAKEIMRSHVAWTEEQLRGTALDPQLTIAEALEMLDPAGAERRPRFTRNGRGLSH